ncbi:hypothetical protein K0038_01239 [Pseudomonas syringae]|uniref:DUF5908 family protein n=1 Tax=Pseudomonas syringae TaxID=317 RepID=UPI0015C45AAE|nr:DUF5908 family protein [Pseudomonas syringae]MCI3944231.1 hypothetical protein [Pseudomonas syringae]
MPVEIRELVIQTRIVSHDETEKEPLSAERMAQLKKTVVQECLRLLKEKTAKRIADR